MLQDVSQKIPVTNFSVAHCLREGLVRIIGRVLEAKAFTAKGAATDVGKASLEEVGSDGTRWQAELVGFDGFAMPVATLEVNQTYEFFGLALQAADDKNGFAFKWVKGAGVQKTPSVSSYFAAGAAAVWVWRVRICASLFGGSCGSFNFGKHLPVTGSRKFDNKVVWEIPWVKVLDTGRQNHDDWHDVGCTECYIRVFAHSIKVVPVAVMPWNCLHAQANELFAAGGLAEAGTLEPAGQAKLLEPYGA